MLLQTLGQHLLQIGVLSTQIVILVFLRLFGGPFFAFRSRNLGVSSSRLTFAMGHFLFLGQWPFHLVNQSVLLLVGLLDGGALGGLPRILGFFTLGSLGSQLRGFGAGFGWLVFRGVWLDVGVFLLLLLWTVLFF